MDYSSGLIDDCPSLRIIMVMKEQVVMKGKQPELCETSWMFKFYWNITDLLPMNSLRFKTMIKLHPVQAGKGTVVGNKNAEFK